MILAKDLKTYRGSATGVPFNTSRPTMLSTKFTIESQALWNSVLEKASCMAVSMFVIAFSNTITPASRGSGSLPTRRPKI